MKWPCFVGSGPQRGIALIAVLWIVSALSVIVTGVVHSVRSEVRLVSVARQSTEAAALGEAGIGNVRVVNVAETHGGVACGAPRAAQQAMINNTANAVTAQNFYRPAAANGCGGADSPLWADAKAKAAKTTKASAKPAAKLGASASRKTAAPAKRGAARKAAAR